MSDKICSQGHVFLGNLCKRCGGGSSAPFILEEEVPTIPASVLEGSLPEDVPITDESKLDEPEPKSKKRILKINKMKKVRK